MSERDLAYIAIIKSLAPIPEADKIEKAEVLGWECVVKKGDFQVGDTAIYIEIDSVLPEYPCFEFMRSRKFRVKTIKLRSQISQGLVMPLSTITDIDHSFDLSKLQEGDNVSEVLKITKYDPECLSDIDLEPQAPKSWLKNQWPFIKYKLFAYKKIKSVNGFPSDVPKTDEVRVQKMGGVLARCVGARVYIAEKLEGTSVSFVYRKRGNWLARLFGQNYLFQACSRNRIVFSSNKKVLSTHNTAKLNDKYGIESRMKLLGRNLAIQGECIGPKIQANVYRLPEIEFRIFSAFDLDKQAYVGYYELVKVCDQLGLPMVPVLAIDEFLLNDIKYYVELSKGYSAINPKVLREGLVIRTLDSSLSFKSINPEYLLNQKD